MKRMSAKYFMLLSLGLSVVSILPFREPDVSVYALERKSNNIEVEPIYEGYDRGRGKTTYRGKLTFAIKLVNGVPDFQPGFPNSEIHIEEDGTFGWPLTHSPNAPGASKGTEYWIASPNNLSDYIHVVVQENPNPVTISEIEVTNHSVSGKTRPGATVQLGAGKIVKADANGDFRFDESISEWGEESRTLMAVVEEGARNITSRKIDLNTLASTKEGNRSSVSSRAKTQEEMIAIIVELLTNNPNVLSGYQGGMQLSQESILTFAQEFAKLIEDEGVRNNPNAEELKFKIGSIARGGRLIMPPEVYDQITALILETVAANPNAVAGSNGLVSTYGVSPSQLGDKITFKNEARQMSVTLERQGDTWDFNVTEPWVSGERETQYFGIIAQESEKTITIERLRSADPTSIHVSTIWDLSSYKMDVYSGKRIFLFLNAHNELALAVPDLDVQGQYIELVGPSPVNEGDTNGTPTLASSPNSNVTSGSTMNGGRLGQSNIPSVSTVRSGGSGSSGSSGSSSALTSEYGISEDRLYDGMRFRNKIRNMHVTIRRSNGYWLVDVTQPLGLSPAAKDEYSGNVNQVALQTLSIERARPRDPTTIKASTVWNLDAPKMNFYNGQRIYVFLNKYNEIALAVPDIDAQGQYVELVEY